MVLLTDVERAKLLDHGAARARGEVRDPPPVVKLFTPDFRAVWLLTEIDPGDGDMAYGLCDAGLGFPELGKISLSYLGSMRGPKGMQVARDLNFTASRTLSEYARIAEIAGSIID